MQPRECDNLKQALPSPPNPQFLPVRPRRERKHYQLNSKIRPGFIGRPDVLSVGRVYSRTPWAAEKTKAARGNASERKGIRRNLGMPPAASNRDNHGPRAAHPAAAETRPADSAGVHRSSSHCTASTTT